MVNVANLKINNFPMECNQKFARISLIFSTHFESVRGKRDNDITRNIISKITLAGPLPLGMHTYMLRLG